VFGAIGVTEEHELHYYTRRLWQWRAEGGSEHWWSERLGRQVLAAGGAALWPFLTGSEPV
jgi:acyl-CoA dehydrogenase